MSCKSKWRLVVRSRFRSVNFDQLSYWAFHYLIVHLLRSFTFFNMSSDNGDHVTFHFATLIWCKNWHFSTPFEYDSFIANDAFLWRLCHLQFIKTLWLRLLWGDRTSCLCQRRAKSTAPFCNKNNPFLYLRFFIF